MASTIVTTGIDIGTDQVKVVVAEHERGSGRPPRIIATGLSESRGLRHGYIMNTADASRCVEAAIKQAEKKAGVRIKRAYVAIGGVGLASVTSTGSVAVSRADSSITELDINNLTTACETNLPQSETLNRKILHQIPLKHKIDGKEVLGNPLGMKGTKLEADVLYITCLEHHINDISDAVADVGIEVLDVIASPLAASFVTLTKTQRIAGCALVNIGAETTSLIVFENDIPISLEVFPIGSTDITNDIAIGLRIPLAQAEEVKTGRTSEYPQKRLEEIVKARLTDMFELIDVHLKKIKRDALLPAGVVITGGGSGIKVIEEFAKSSLKLPSEVASLKFAETTKGYIRDSSWSVAYGLSIFGIIGDDHLPIGSRVLSGTGRSFKGLIGWLKKFLP